MEKPTIALSVHELVDAALPLGDLVLIPGSGKRLQEGTRLHQQYQKSVQTPGYQAEVPLSYTLDSPQVTLVISGRIDGIIDRGDEVILEELKTTGGELAAFDPPPQYWAQALCYGAMWCLSHDTGQVTLRLIAIQLHSGQTKAYTRRYDAGVIIGEFTDLCQRVVEHIEKRAARQAARNRSLLTLGFPFADYRPGQRAMAAAVYRAIRDKRPALLEAPTGIGKTMAALFPAVKGLAQGWGERIFYLAARGTLKQIAQQSVSVLLEGGAELLCVTITAKDKCCPTPGAGCHPGTCPLAAGYYDRLPAAVDEGCRLGLADAESLADLARRHSLCPFELSLDLALEADIIICDFNYAFDPRVKLRRFFEDGGDHILLVDECHNLIDRARDMFSAQLDWEDVMKLKRALPSGNLKGEVGRLKDVISGLQRAFVQLRHFLAQVGGSMTGQEPPQVIAEAVEHFVSVARDWVDAGGREPFMENLTELYFLCRNYQAAQEGFDGCCTVLMESREPHVRVRIYCMDPASRLAEAYKKARCGLFFSATLSPMAYYARMLGLADCVRLSLPSPFPREHLFIASVDYLPTTYRQREHSLTGLCRCLKAMASSRPGCYLAFFPSYPYMQLAHQLFCALYPEIEAPIQRQGMDDPARMDFLEHFTPDHEKTLLAFAVMGGLFSEGIDLAGDRLSGAAIVGVGLPQMDMERGILRAYHDELGEDGFAYSYAYPGFNRVMQAAGRVIRSDTDRGLVLLIDPRFTQRRYEVLYPGHWLPLKRCKSPGALSEQLKTFWEQGADGDS